MHLLVELPPAMHCGGCRRGFAFMKSALTKVALGVGSLSLAIAGAASAGGLKREGYNIDLLFDPSPFAAEATATYVSPNRKLNNVRDTNPRNGEGTGASNGVKDTPGYWMPRVGLKAGFGEAVDCLVDYSEPWGVHTNPGPNWVGANDNIQTKVSSHNYGATCSYKFQLGRGQLRFLGGAFYQELSGFKEQLVAPVPAITGSNLYGNGVGHLELGGNGMGWRIGMAYEIPEIALRASLVYNSEVRLDDITGKMDLTQVPAFIDPRNPLLGRVTSIFGSAVMPQTLKFSLQSGVAPDWLAFGSVEWIQWSKLQSIAFCPEATRAIACTDGGPTEATSLDLLYRDGWTIQGGLGHKFSEQWSGGASITWDRGTSTGVGYQSDTWSLGLGASYTPGANVELRLAGALGVMTSGSSGAVVRDGAIYGQQVAYTFGNDLVSAVSANLKIRW